MRFRAVLVVLVVAAAGACGGDSGSDPTTTSGVPLVADFDFTYDLETPSPTFCRAVDFAFTDTSTGAPTAWRWDFGNGETSTEQNPRLDTLEPGPAVTLTVSRGSVTDSITKQLGIPAC